MRPESDECSYLSYPRAPQFARRNVLVCSAVPAACRQRKEEVILVGKHAIEDGLHQRIIGINQHVVGLKTIELEHEVNDFKGRAAKQIFVVEATKLADPLYVGSMPSAPAPSQAPL